MTELVWPNKRKEVERAELPFQTVEIVNLPRGQQQEEIFASDKDNWKNRLIWGDNLLVMGSLLEEFAGKVNLIYIDPPFATGDDFSFTVDIGDQAEITKEPSALEVKAYRDTWGKGLQSYLQMMYDRLILMRDLLAGDGSIFVHLDSTVGHYVKVMMDEIFRRENFRRQIIWVMSGIAGYKGLVNNFVRGHDLILYYTKSQRYKFNKTHLPYSEKQLARFSGVDEAGRRYKPITKERRLYLDEARGLPVTDVWSDIAGFHTIVNAPEDVGYPTQKPEKLAGRIINSSSEEGDLVADFFCGSGTTGVVAEKLGRRWIMTDLGKFATQVTRKRLLDMGAKPFVVQNLGKYERHRWVTRNGKGEDCARFILELYKADPIEGFNHLHGKKGNSFVHVGAVDAPITLTEISEALNEAKENNVAELDVLGWEWEMGLHDLVKEEAEKYGVKLVTLQIPREVMEISASEAKKKDIQFFELAYLDVKAETKGKLATVNLNDFIIPNPELLPKEVQDKVKSWSDFIDYWAIDWMFNQHPEQTEVDDTFHNMNQRYRTRKEPKLELSMSYEYEKAGKYNVLVKVIDIFGNDTTKLVEVNV